MAWWQEHPWRLIQTNLREIDMRDISADRVVADLQDVRATVLMINAAGIIASYPTKLPQHFPSPYLTGDSLHDILDACHTAGMRVVARTDFSKVRRPIFEQYPQWAYRTADGAIVDYNGDVHVCICGEYQQHFALEILRELLATHDFDGVFFNMGGFVTHDYSGNAYGPCHCAACARRFGEMFRRPLPLREGPADAAWEDYEEFRHVVRREHEAKVSRFLRELKGDLCIANHLSSGSGFIRQESNTAMDRPLPHWQYDASDNTRWARASHPEMVSSNTSVDFIDFPYRHVAVSPHQQALRLAQGLASGGSLDWYLIGRLDNHADRSGFAPVREMFAHHAAHEDSYRDLRSVASICLLKGGGDVGEYRGWFRFLAENHFLFDVLTAEAAAGMPEGRYEAIVCPDIERMGDELAARLDAFVRRGGTLLATGRSGLRDAFGRQRPAPALDSPGIDGVEHVRMQTRASYFHLGDRAVLRRLAQTDLVYLDGPYVYARYADDVRRRHRLIPPHPFGPPERCYYSETADHPAYVERSVGDGRVVYVPWLPGALFHRQGHTNTADFAGDLLEQAVGCKPVAGNLPPQVEVTLHRSRSGGFELLHLVNASGHFGTSFYAPVPMHGLEVVIPRGDRPGGVGSLVCPGGVQHAWSDGLLTLRVERLGLLEAIRID